MAFERDGEQLGLCMCSQVSFRKLTACMDQTQK